MVSRQNTCPKSPNILSNQVPISSIGTLARFLIIATILICMSNPSCTLIILSQNGSDNSQSQNITGKCLFIIQVGIKKN